MQVPFYRVDAFTSSAFCGNPAAVVLLQEWLDDVLLQAIAAEENVPATAFLVRGSSAYDLRWFAPGSELELCGHASLAAAYVLLDRNRAQCKRVAFTTRAGSFQAARDGTRVALDLPRLAPQRRCESEPVAAAIGVAPLEVWEAAGGRGLAVLEKPEEVRALRADSDAIAALPFSALIVTAPGAEADCDFVSRYFAPKHGIAEDFVTGSAHCVLTPYWAGVVDKKRLFARQLSTRGGELWIEDCGDRVRIAGHCVRIAEGTLTIP